jgi:hypothetical protein
MSKGRALAGTHVGRELVFGGTTSTVALVLLEVLLVSVRRLTLALQIVGMILL